MAAFAAAKVGSGSNVTCNVLLGTACEVASALKRSTYLHLAKPKK